MYKRIPILMAADNNYIRYLWVAVLSMLINKKETTSYDFYILSPATYPKDVLKAFNILEQRYPRTTFNFVMMGDLFNDIQYAGQILPAPTYYYLKIADIVTKYDKAIYLDPDIIVLKDLSELYDIELGDNYVAGVKAAGYVQNLEYRKIIGIKDISQYINANSLIFNLNKIRQDNLTEKFIELSQKQYPSMDQDVLNIVCYDKILHIDFKYNLMTKYLPISGNKQYNKELLIDVYGEKNLIDANDDPVVIHYANVGVKPWNSILPKNNYWWHYAVMSPWKHRFILSFVKNIILKLLKSIAKMCFSIEKTYKGNKKIKKYNIFCFKYTRIKERNC